MNPELQATHQILSLFEKSKASAEKIFEDLPGIFVNCDQLGHILRANRELSRLLNLNYEDILQCHFSVMFSEDDWAKFAAKLAEALEGKSQFVEFELPIKGGEGNPVDFHWQISPMKFQRANQTFSVLTCMGRDISEVKFAQARALNLAKNLEVTKVVQTMLLPPKTEIKTNNIDLAVAYEAADLASGDYWWIDVTKDGRIWIVVGDITGHGVGSAMMTAVISGSIQALVEARNSSSLAVDVPMILRSMDRALSNLENQPYWMTVSAVEIDCKRKVMNWWGAASPPMFFIADDETLAVIGQESSPLGSGSVYLSSGQVQLKKRHRIVLMTDGLLESMNANAVQFGERRMAKLVENSRELSPQQMRKVMIEKVRDWRGGSPPNDDATVLIIDWLS